MKKRLTVAALTAALACAGAAGQAFAADLKINDHVTLGGAIEVEVSHSEDFEGASETSIDLATAKFALETEVNEWASGVLAIEWDGDADKFAVDEAFVKLGETEAMPAYLKGGRFVVPFGVYDANTLADPLTKEAFETKEDNLLVGVAAGPVTVDAFVYKGETNEGGGDASIDKYGLAVGYARENDMLTVGVHASYTNSLFDSDGLQEVFDPEADYVGGVALQTSVQIVGVGLIGEYITAIDDYEAVDMLSGENVKRKPSAYHVEVSYSLDMAMPLIFAVGYSETEELAGVFPEKRIMGTVGIELAEGVGFSVGFSRDTDYGVGDGGAGEDADSLTAQLAYEF
ncbi:MAG: hypothetical protein CSA20_07830 [Deltaproteobacteria bacterium]|nr:MAG: hypothetical protein CSA20_07830 [Deltaproteobacteria bacterium]